MISHFDTADQAIEKTIKTMCIKLEKTNPENDAYMILVKSIAALRASQNAPIIQDQ